MSDEKIISANSSDKKISCSFCGKSQEEVKKLIAGPNVYICNECVVLCKDCLLYTSPSPRDLRRSRMPSSA